MKPCAESVAAFLSFRFTHLAEVLEVSFVAGLLEDSPGLFRQLVRNAVEVELAILGAFEGLVACADVSAPFFLGHTVSYLPSCSSCRYQEVSPGTRPRDGLPFHRYGTGL